MLHYMEEFIVYTTVYMFCAELRKFWSQMQSWQNFENFRRKIAVFDHTIHLKIYAAKVCINIFG